MVAVLALACCACGRIDFDPLARNSDAQSAGDALDATAATCATWSAFSAPVHVTELSTTSNEFATAVSADNLSIIFDSDRPGGAGGWDLYEATRTDPSLPFGMPSRITELDGTSDEDNPALSPDGLHIYYGEDITGMPRLWYAPRPDRTKPFFSATLVAGDFSNLARSTTPSLSPDELTIYFAGAAATGNDWEIYTSTRATMTFPFSIAMMPIPSLTSPYADWTPSVSADGLELFFQSDRASAGSQSYDIWVSRRATTADAWGTPTPVPGVSTVTYSETDPTISYDGTTLWFGMSGYPGGLGGSDLYYATRTCM